MPRPPTSLFEDAIDVPMWLEADRLAPYAERVRRDRDIARRLPRGNTVKRVRGWWRLAPADPAESVGARLARFRTLLTLLMTVVGAAAGVTVALAAFHYDGSQPVNVVRLIALLVGLQLLFLLFTLLLIPGRVIGLRRLQDLVATITPGALAVSIFRRLARPPPELARLFDWHAARASAGRFAKWQLLCWSQVAAVAFNVAALATAIALVTFTDLAFGWSTTLQTRSRNRQPHRERDRVALACHRAERRSYARAHRAVAVFSSRGRRRRPRRRVARTRRLVAVHDLCDPDLRPAAAPRSACDRERSPARS